MGFFGVDTKRNKRNLVVLFSFLLGVFFLFVLSLCIGSSNLSFSSSFLALFGQGQDNAVRIVTKIRLPEALAALIAGAGLALSGLIMQTCLGNIMASPGTLGVSNAAVFGANVSIIVFAGGYVSTGKNAESLISSVNPFACSSFAFAFALLSTAIILLLAKLKRFSPSSLVLSGVALGAVWSALTTILQFYATDVGLSAAVIWSFGDIGRASFQSDLVMGIVVLLEGIFFFALRHRYNALLRGDGFASSLGINVSLLRFLSLLMASLVTAVCVSYLGIIGFVGIICPHIARKLVGENHTPLIPETLLCGSALLLFSNVISKAIAPGNALPIGAVTSLLGAPFFLYLIFASRGKREC
jgi:iron complex transport system permease protein